MSKILSMNKHAISTALIIILGLVATACNAVPGAAINPITVINTPLNNAQLKEGDQVSVQSTSTDQSGIVRVELSIDNMVVRTDQLPQTQTTAILVQNWTATAGTHTITVRGVNSADVSSAPSSIAISVAPTNPVVLVVTATPIVIPVVQVAVVTSTPGACVNNSVFVSDVTVPDKAVLAAGQAFVKTWRVRNTGTCSWGNDEELVFVRGEAMTPAKVFVIPAAVPGATIDLSVAMTAPATSGNYVGTWRMRNHGGTIFGSTFNVTINVPGPTPVNTPISCPSAPVIQSFAASSTTITSGQSATLSWGAVTGAQSAEIDNDIGGVATPGSVVVSPTKTTTYSLTGICGDKSKTLQVTINVNPVALLAATPTATVTNTLTLTPTVKP